MLNLHDIQERIAQPSICRNEDISQLKELCEEFPYTQIYPILYLKALALTNDVRFDNALQSYAYRIADRHQLFQLLQTKESGQETFSSLEKEETQKTEVTDSVETISGQLESSTETHKTLEQLPVQLDQSFQESSVTLSELEIAEDWEEEIDTGITLNISSNNEGEIKTEEPSTLDPIEQDSINEESDLQSKILTQVDQFERELIAEAISANFTIEEIPSNDQKESTVEIEPTVIDAETIEETEISTSGKRSFSSWLKSNEKGGSHEIEDEKSHIDDLINRFIDNEPRISRPTQKETIDRPKKPFFSPTQVAKESIDVQVMPVSETLAKIFVVQGNYPKAIFAYEQLILLNPEKKAFFASQIEELKKKLTQ